MLKSLSATSLLACLVAALGCSNGSGMPEPDAEPDMQPDAQPDMQLEPDAQPDAEPEMAPCSYPILPPSTLALDDTFPRTSYPNMLDAARNSYTLDMEEVNCATDADIDWSPFDVLLFISIPAW